jgi:hypothetical protein
MDDATNTAYNIFENSIINQTGNSVNLKKQLDIRSINNQILRKNIVDNSETTNILGNESILAKSKK